MNHNKPIDIDQIRKEGRENLKVKAQNQQENIKINDLGLQYLSKKYITEKETNRILLPLDEREKIAKHLNKYQINYDVKQNEYYQGYCLVKATLKVKDGTIYTANGDALRKDLPDRFANKVMQCAEHNAKYRVLKEIQIPIFLDEIDNPKILDILEQNDIIKEYRKLLLEAPLLKAHGEAAKENVTIEVKEDLKPKTELDLKIDKFRKQLEDEKVNNKRTKDIIEKKNSIIEVVEKKVIKSTRGQITSLRTRLMIVMEKDLDPKITPAHFVVLHKLGKERASLYIQYLDNLIIEAGLFMDSEMIAVYEARALKYIKKLKVEKKGKR